MQAILCQNSFTPQKDNFGLGDQLWVVGYMCEEWLQMANSVTFWSMQMLELSYSRHCGANS